MRMAIAFHNQRNTELIEVAVKSADMNHRIAAAWAFGLQALPKVQQKIMVLNFAKAQAAKIQALAARSQRYGSHQFNSRLLGLVAGLNSMPTLEPTEPLPYSGCLLLLMRDRNAFVASAARDSCAAIASKTFNDANTDFGPMFNANLAARGDAALLWEIYFEKKVKGKAESNQEPAPRADPTKEPV